MDTSPDHPNPPTSDPSTESSHIDLRGENRDSSSHLVRTEKLSQYNYTFFNNFRELLDMIKFEHTVFALPFALLG
ncbi:MAG: hypothetical protein WCL50_12115, partial [Spirochaetota bacterium]